MESEKVIDMDGMGKKGEKREKSLNLLPTPLWQDQLNSRLGGTVAF